MIKLPLKTKNDKEFKEAIEWFEQAFSSPPYRVEPDYTCFKFGGYDIALYQDLIDNTDKKRKNIAYVVVKDIATIFNRFIALGASVIQKPYQLGGEITIARVKNPFGHILCLIDDPSFK